MRPGGVAVKPTSKLAEIRLFDSRINNGRYNKEPTMFVAAVHLVPLDWTPLDFGCSVPSKAVPGIE